jgi:hypothetical protein
MVLLISACSSPSKLLNKGDYYQATIESVRKLRQRPDNTEAQKTLEQSYPLAVKTNLRTIGILSEGSRVGKYDDMISLYEQLNRLADEIYSCPKAMEIVSSPSDFRRELQQTKEKGAEQMYILGEEAMKYRTVDQSRTAYTYFTKANEYVNGYRDVYKLLKITLYDATLRVIAEPPQTPADFKISADFFYTNLISEMNRTNQGKFVRFYTPDEAKNEGMKNPHQYLVLDFLSFTVGNIKESKNTNDVKRDSVITGTVTVDGKKYNAYSTVKAKFTLNIREILSGGTLSVRIIDASNGKVIEQRSFDGTYIWRNSWAVFTGDDRALTYEQKNLLKNQPQIPPPHQDLFVEFTKPIYSKVISYVRSAYYKYYINQAN